MPKLAFEIHPIQLIQIWFPKIDVELDEGIIRDESLLRFPELDVEIDTTFIEDEKLLVTLRLKSEQHFSDDGEDENSEGEEGDTAVEKPLPAVKLRLTAVAVFDVIIDVEDKRSALTEFANGRAPAIVMWPYVRASIADLVTKLGLPPFHIPLVQVPAGTAENLPEPRDTGKVPNETN